ncbi:hypothetical protein Csa_023121 [Cucumis sativus]|nr:hypothetical protein Csa_023121 [Cucumis sativus]
MRCNKDRKPFIEIVSEAPNSRSGGVHRPIGEYFLEKRCKGSKKILKTSYGSKVKEDFQKAQRARSKDLWPT